MHPSHVPGSVKLDVVAQSRRRCQNRILVSENSIPPTDVAARIAAHTLAKRGHDYTTEVRRLLDAAIEVMGKHGTTARARVADIVAAAGMSNDAFYRHFPSKDALVVALLEDGTERLVSYIVHQMGKAQTPEDKIRRWVDGVLSQTREQAAHTTLAVLWNGSSVGSGVTAGRHNASIPLAALLHEPLAALGSATPELDASLVAHAALGKVSDHLWAGTRPNRDEIEHITEFCIDAATPRPVKR
jgi:AcrR family transcriptional regulator